MAAGAGFFEQFIDDYFAECDEHLATVRRIVLELESGDATDAGRQALLRALHTVKGLSGMVGLPSAERVAHLMEETLRVEVGDTEGRVEALFAGTALLEACVTSRRTASPPPDIEPFARRVTDLLGRPASVQVVVASASVAPVPAAIIEDESRGMHRRFTFVPSPERAARGITVEEIRSRLTALGDVVTATPRIVVGRLLFEFEVRTRPGDEPLESWRADGLDWEAMPFESPAVDVDVEPDRRATSRGGASHTVRVDLARLDDLMRMVGELVVSRARLEQTIEHERKRRAAPTDWSSVLEINDAMERQLRALREGVTRIRLVTVGEVFERLRFAAHDVARESGKSIHIEIAGQDTEIDKLVVDRMLEPLLHIVRNAVSHGVESPAERQLIGKEVQGTVSLRARAAGDRIILEVEDDGAGMDTARLMEKARARGWTEVDERARADALLDLLCTPGFSTRDAADFASGRGMGMDIARQTVEVLGGEMFVRTEPGKGTCFTMELPLTLMIADALLVDVAGQTMAVPQLALREIVELDSATVTPLENNEVASYRGRALPLVRLPRVFNLRYAPASRSFVLVVGVDAHLVGLVVDRVLGLQEIVVHPISDPLVAQPGIGGATELADGRVSLILDPAALARTHQRRRLTA